MRKRAWSPTRKKVAALKTKGLTTREISTLLGISTQAVYKHLEGIEKQNGKT